MPQSEEKWLLSTVENRKQTRHLTAQRMAFGRTGKADRMGESLDATVPGSAAPTASTTVSPSQLRVRRHDRLGGLIHEYAQSHDVDD